NEFERSWTPRNMVFGLSENSPCEVIDDLGGCQGYTAGLQNCSRVLQTLSDEGEAILRRPRSTERINKLALCRHPVRFSVDEGAVHVDKNGGGKLGGHDIRVYGDMGSTSHGQSEGREGLILNRRGEL